MAKWSESHNGKFPDPYAKLKIEDDSKKDKKKKKKKLKLMQQQQQSQIDANGNKVRNKPVNVLKWRRQN